MTRWAQVTFALLAVATFGAFFVAQRLKRQPPLILRTNVAPRNFSPNGDGVRDHVRAAVRLKKADDVSIAVVNRDDDVIRQLVSNRHLAARQKTTATWDGRDDNGHLAPNGFYRFRLGLRDSGRSVNIPFETRLDDRRPHPVITRVAGRNPRDVTVPLILRAGSPRPISVRFRGSTRRRAQLLVVRTDGRRPRVVDRTTIPARRLTATWDGKVAGHAPPPGIYRLQIKARSQAGTVGYSSPVAPGGGFTVRGVAVQPPLEAIRAGHVASLLVDARGRHYTWSLRRAGGLKIRAHGSDHGVRLHVRMPRARGIYILSVRAGSYGTRVPLVVRSAKHFKVLVVLPAFAWTAETRTDDDGDGNPDVLGGGGDRVRVTRTFSGLPDLGAEAQVMLHLDSAVLPYNVTTDVALARGHGPSLKDASGVIFPGREDWLPRALGAKLRSYVEGGGRVASFATQSLRRPATLSGDTLTARGGLRATDVFAARFAPVRHRTKDLVVFKNGAGVFDTVGGLFAKWPAWEATRSAGPGKLVALAGPDPDTPVIVGIELGKGLVIRTGAVGWANRLGRDDAVDAFTEHAWTLLGR